MSIASAQRAAAGTYVNIVDVISLDDMRTTEDQLNAIILARPDLIFITGGTENGAREPVLERAQIVRLALRLMRKAAPTCSMRATARSCRKFARCSITSRRCLSPTTCVRRSTMKSLGTAQAQLASRLRLVHRAARDWLRRSGHDVAGGDSADGAELSRDCQLSGQDRRTERRRAGGGCRQRREHDVGVGQRSGRRPPSAPTSAWGTARAPCSTRSGWTRCAKWLPFYATDNEILAYALNKTLRPATIPEDAARRCIWNTRWCALP